MLNMRMVSSPLSDEEYRTILAEYNRLTSAGIPMNEFLRWVRDSPEGPAWHALLQTDEGRVVGHTSVLPIRARLGDRQMVTAMSEYSFVHEDFRKLKIRGYETVSRPTFIILLDELFKHCQKEGWGPIFASTNEKNQVFTRKVGLRPAEFPLTECLLILRPFGAARHTPNISRKQRAVLYFAGLAQKSVWSVGKYLPRRTNGMDVAPIGDKTAWPDADRLSFYEEKDSFGWRYIEEQYVRYELAGAAKDYIVAKRGREDRYLRVCQYRLSSATSVNSVVRHLIAQAGDEKAMGIRWAVYDEGSLSGEIVGRLRRLGFLCAPRVRIVMVHKDFAEYLQPSVWRMSDAHFSFDP